ncbi:serine proteinase [Macrolepiota fuliginosa MF-IS2]|uniref:Serine proteinase n=1 Tax=Macrolepiota fuliginosa MF-IS2 TaxID=1400762 RepID=A0A9P5X9B3_9AGAR|nr:serine proteinase [Macrolepiota fuliginosa MF-IS2]
MLLPATFITLVALLITTFAAPEKRFYAIEKYDGETTGRYIVTFKADVDKPSLRLSGAAIAVTHQWDGIINGFAGTFNLATLEELRANPDVESISEDGITNDFVTQTSAPWGISRLSSATKLTSQNTGALTFSYTYDSTACAEVDIYIVDTGVFTTHTQFGGRATWGATFGDHAGADDNGPGTRTARGGTAAGSQFGVAKAASVIAVKVLSDAGSGSVADIISGLNYVLSQQSLMGRPIIVSMSLGGSASTTLNNTVASRRNPRRRLAVAAGNSNIDASSISPPRTPLAVTVDASTIADVRVSFSNFGPAIDAFAPGQNVISAWISSTATINNISGTSMATPHVAGLIAYLTGLQGNTGPATMGNFIQSLSLEGVLTRIRTYPSTS